MKVATRGALWKRMFLEISENSKENTCVVSFLIKLQTFYLEHLWTTASDIINLKYKFEQIGPRIKASLYLHENWHTRQLEESECRYDMIKRFEEMSVQCSISVRSTWKFTFKLNWSLLNTKIWKSFSRFCLIYMEMKGKMLSTMVI